MNQQHNMMTFEQDSQMLETNMDCITSELSDLIIGRSSSASNGNSTNAIISGSPLIVPIHKHAYISSIDQLRYSFESFYRMNVASNIQTPMEITEMRPIVARPRSQSVDFSVSQLPLLRQFSTNALNKRRASAADVEQHEALLCAAIEKCSPDSHLACLQSNKRCGIRRKYSRIEPKDHIDYDSVVIDLKAIGLSTSNREPNDVLRLFGLFRKLHHYLNDKILFVAEPVTTHPTKPVPFMPRTMNVLTQIKHCIHKANFFCFRLFEKLDQYKLADRDKYFECYRSVSLLRKMVKQLEPFKIAELEHKNGVFVNSFGAAQAKNLEILLSQLIEKIRECNIFVEIYLFSVKNNAETVDSPSMETLKKAVAIAGAMCTNRGTTTSGKKDNLELCDLENCNNDKSTENDSSGGGIADGAVVPAPDLNSRISRFLGV